MPAQQTIYPDKKTAEAGDFVELLKINCINKEKGTFDSAAGSKVLSEVSANGLEAPEELKSMLDQFHVGSEKEDNKTRSKLASAILDGCEIYNEAHGEYPSADIILSALHQGYSTTDQASKISRENNYLSYDSASATSQHHDQLAMKTGRAAIAVMMGIGEAVPFAHHLPASLESNESNLIILNHRAGSDWGAYRKNDLMDGGGSGMSYVNSARVIALKPDGNSFVGQITSLINQNNHEECVSVADGAKAVKLMRGRTKIYVSGLIAGHESSSTGSGASSPISGEITLAGTQHVVTGSIKPDTGETTITFTPPLPTNTKVHCEAFVDYEVQPELTPEFNTSSQKFKIWANAWRAKTNQTVDATTQFKSEVGIDISAESMFSLRQHVANERHYDCLAKANRLQDHNNETWKFDTQTQLSNKSYAAIFEDFAPTLNLVDQTMANNTMDYSSKFMYVGRKVAALLSGFPRSIFEPSGIQHRPGIYRLGTYKGKKVYFNPKAIESDTGSRILLIGRSSQVARSPFILGDAVAPMIIKFAAGPDMSRGMGWYTRCFTEVNPHTESALGVGSIDITGLPS